MCLDPKGVTFPEGRFPWGATDPHQDLMLSTRRYFDIVS
jgi:hypothetical protein